MNKKATVIDWLFVLLPWLLLGHPGATAGRGPARAARLADALLTVY